MFPSRDLIERLAYERWERRGRIHGFDREDWMTAEADLIFDLTYRAIATYPLEASSVNVLGDERRPRCRFCEQAPPRASFGSNQLVVPHALGNSALFSREICSECAEQFANTLDPEFLEFWRTLQLAGLPFGSIDESRMPAVIPIGAYKCLIKTALLILPGKELAGFTDTIEWVGNPDHEFDLRLFDGLKCRVYRVNVPYDTPWVSLFRRIDEEAPFPYMMFFLASGRIVIQAHLPLCAQDEDLDGEEVLVPRRSFSTGEGPEFQAGHSRDLPLKRTDRPERKRVRLFA